MTQTTDAEKPYVVKVDDNFHYQDEDERYTLGAFESLEAAIAACKQIVDACLVHEYKPGMTAAELYDSYVSFGEDPFILSPEPIAFDVTKLDLSPSGLKNLDLSGIVPFCAWDYAKAKAEVMCSEGVTRQ